jgi:predicted RNA-binding Zn ribbon-like protein
LNRLLGRDEAFGVIETAAADANSASDQHASGLRWHWHRRWRSPDALLLPVAQAMADLVCEADFTQVKNCEGPTCTMLFLDTSKGRGRRWCSMSVCGNRAKQARHRAGSSHGKKR